MIPWLHSVLTGLIICIPFTAFVLVTFRWTPRVWLHSLPPDIARAAGPKTEGEERVTRYVMLPIYLLILPGLSTLSAVWLADLHAIDLSFWAAVAHLYIVWTIVHLWDLVAIDGVYAMLIDPARPPIAGTEGASGWKDHGFHVRQFFRAVVMSALFVVPMSVIVGWLV